MPDFGSIQMYKDFFEDFNEERAEDIRENRGKSVDELFREVFKC